MNQTRLGSFIEAMMNTAIGLAVSLAANALVFPAFGFRPSIGENVAISLIYTVISIVRQYVLRRWFNARLHRLAVSMSGGNEGEARKLSHRPLCDVCPEFIAQVNSGEVSRRCPKCGTHFINRKYLVRT